MLHRRLVRCCMRSPVFDNDDDDDDDDDDDAAETRIGVLIVWYMSSGWRGKCNASSL